MTHWHNVFQPIYHIDANLHKKAAYYEMLLRGEDDRFPAEEFLQTLNNEEDGRRWLEFEKQSLHELFARCPGIRVHLNLDPVQFAYPSVWTFLKECHDLYGDHVIIEITERQDAVRDKSDEYFDKAFHKIHALGFKIALDDVDSGGNSLEFVKKHLDDISCIKLSLLVFKGMEMETALMFMAAWTAFARDNNLDMVLEAVPNWRMCACFAGLDHTYIQANILHAACPITSFEA